MINDKNLNTYLIEIDCELLETTNPWEVVRFSADGIICVIYQNSKGAFKYSSDLSRKIHDSYFDGKKINVKHSTQRKRTYKDFKSRLIKRDGLNCFYSNLLMTNKMATVEHLIPLSRGGTNNIDNMVLCLEEQNQKVGNMSLMKKIKYRDELRNKEVKNG